MAVVGGNSRSSGVGGKRAPVSFSTLVNVAFGFLMGFAASHFLQNDYYKSEPINQSTTAASTSTATATAKTMTTASNSTANLDAASETHKSSNTTTPPPSPEVSHRDNEQEQPQPNSDQQLDFYEIGLKTHTDKVTAKSRLPGCLENDSTCTRPSCVRPNCRPWGHFYQTMYQQRLGPYSTKSTPPFQFLEVGFYTGSGFEAYKEFLPNAEIHSMEISCIEEGPRSEGKWPWGNFAAKNKKWYDTLLQQDRLHCGDANNVTWLDEIWRTKMHRPDAPPLKVVVDDGSHLAAHMIQSVFFWFPRIEPGGMMIVEDVQPIQESNLFRTQFLPQIMSDLHFCGDPKEPKDEPCFPTLWPLLQSIHCEMHICVFERNSEPAQPNFDLELSTRPEGAFDLSSCMSLQEPFGLKTARRRR